MNPKRKAPIAPAVMLDRIFSQIIDMLPYDWADMVELAEAADVSPVTIWNWYSGHTKSPRLITLAKVASALGFNIELVAVRHLKLVK